MLFFLEEIVMKLSKLERLILANQYRILECVDPENRDDHAFARLTLERGFELETDGLTDGYYEWLDAAECDFVTDVFVMYRTLQDAYAALADKRGIKPTLVEMPGFDGSGESQYLAYARFVVNEKQEFEEVRVAQIAAADLNSHMPTVGRYREMLARWKQLEVPERYDLDRAALLQVLGIDPFGETPTDSDAEPN
jgi:uncharacterized protein YfbU (UPF0304 family)